VVVICRGYVDVSGVFVGFMQEQITLNFAGLNQFADFGRRIDSTLRPPSKVSPKGTSHQFAQLPQIPHLQPTQRRNYS